MKADDGVIEDLYIHVGGDDSRRMGSYSLTLQLRSRQPYKPFLENRSRHQQKTHILP